MKMLLFLIFLLPFVKCDDNYSHLKTFKNLTKFVDFIFWSTREEYPDKYIPHFAENFVYHFGWFKFNRDQFAYVNALRKVGLIGELLKVKGERFDYVFENGEKRRFLLLSVIANTTDGYTELKIYKLNEHMHFRMLSGNQLLPNSQKIPGNEKQSI
ncbi:unnamed protein product [Caenorhabditis angaria]|uniref:Uncharacterized protein n=1 Tax=Caenorhabditis angaria TaxID=860376 RepID=A0A9P1N913_9PELO|nr:unnamed protein product [Caenorhabditis angaria]